MCEYGRLRWGGIMAFTLKLRLGHTGRTPVWSWGWAILWWPQILWRVTVDQHRSCVSVCPRRSYSLSELGRIHFGERVFMCFLWFGDL